MSLCTLPFDVCDRLLTFLPDFLSLQHAVLASKLISETFSSRKRSIMRAVMTNEVGPALSFAAALVRTMNKLGDGPMQVLLEGLNDSSPDSHCWTCDVTGAEARALSGVSAAVQRLESYFCILHKDRTAAVSTLSEEESYRFHRAIYRIWICSVLANDRHNNSRPLDLDVSFLKNMSEEELVQMHEAMQFLDVVYNMLMATFQGPFDRSGRPFELRVDELLAAFDGNFNAQTFGIALHRSATAIVNSYTILARDRQASELLKKKYNSQAILVNARVEEVQACQKCLAQAQDLFGENNWHLLRRMVTFDVLLSFLPGKVNANVYVRSDLNAILVRRTSPASILSEMFDGQNDPNNDWKRTDWLCISCIHVFLSQRIYSWFVGELVKNGHQFKENCWYGWNCRTQTHKPDHAKKLNHLCEPTERDDTERNEINANLNANHPVVIGIGNEGEENEEDSNEDEDMTEEEMTEDEDGE
ncbi:hypothetical protein ACEPAF_3272 [Sanghuangporus sanghuang]